MSCVVICRICFLYFFLFMSVSCRDFYSILNVDRTATINDIKTAYRKLARQLHPDKNPGNELAAKKFQDVNAAYEVLSDETKRSKYDECGEECVSREGMMSNMDPFANFFGDFFSFGGSESRENKDLLKGGNIVMRMYVTLEELYNGNFVELSRNKVVFKEAKGVRKCNCRQEMITKQLGPGRFQMMQQNVCDECPNVKLSNEEKVLEFEVERGMKNGQQTRFIAEGEPHIDGEPGDLIIAIKTMPHPVFERKGNDLFTNLTVSLQDALIGFTTKIKHLDGSTFDIKRESITPPGTILKKKGKGMPHYEDNNLYGTLYVKVDVSFPKVIFTGEEKLKISEILNQPSNFKAYNGLRGY